MSQSGETAEGVSVSKRVPSSEEKVKTQSPLQQERAHSLVPTCVSMKSDRSMEIPDFFSKEVVTTEPGIQQERAHSPVPTCVSMKSDRSMEHPPNFSKGVVTDEGEHQEIPGVLSGQFVQGHQTDLASIFTILQETVMTFVKQELKRFQKILNSDYPECLEIQREKEEQRSSAREGALKITLHFLRQMNQQELADTLEDVFFDCPAMKCQRQLKTKLKKKFECMFEGITDEGNSTLLNQIYTELHITEGGSGEVNTEHEVRQIEAASRKPVRSETPIRVNDIFKGPPGRDKPIRTVLTKGVAGIGKTVSTQKFTLDWADGKANQNTHFILPLSFRELNLLKGIKCSFMELLNKFFVEIKELGAQKFHQCKVVFIFDGLDEYQLPLDFKKNEIWTNVTESTSVDVLLTNLIKGNLLPSAQLWITTRPAAANQIPSECFDMVTEVRGFTDPQKEEYFTKRFSGKENMASRVISYIKTSRSLHIMCHIPVFCCITATVLQHKLIAEERGELPRTLTEMYIHFLVFQSIQGNFKYHGRAETDSHWNTESRKTILSVGKWAFQQLKKGNLIFYESDLTECGIDVRAASVCSGLFTSIFREGCGLYQSQDKVFSFVHLSIQEFLAAVYVILSFFNDKSNVMEEPQSACNQSLHNVHRVAINKALQNKNGRWDLFLRFLLGLSLESNQRLLHGLLTRTRVSSNANEKTIKHIKTFLDKDDLSLERGINLIHCLNELGDTSLVQEVQSLLTRRDIQLEDLSASQISALVFVLATSVEQPDVFDLKKYSRSETGLLKLLPVLETKTPRTLLLSGGTVTEGGFASLVSALRSNPSHMRELDLSYNHPVSSGVKLLSTLLEDPQCRLETLRLSNCLVTREGCAIVVSAVKVNPSHLRELDLSNNNLQDSGVELLSGELNKTTCKLETLRLSGCVVTEKGCASLASALRSNLSHLILLDLSYNHPGISGEKLLYALLEDPHCSLKTLRVDHGGEFRIKPGLTKYACDLTLDPNTAHRNISLSEENRKATRKREKQLYPDHPERFNYREQVLCSEGLTESRWYWEVEWRGAVYIGVTYRGINRRGDGGECLLGANNKSWSLSCYDNIYTVCHNEKSAELPVSPSGSTRVGVYLDCPGGTLSFYRVSSDTLTLLHTFHSTFTEPLYPGFGVWWQEDDSSMSLCQVEEEEERTKGRGGQEGRKRNIGEIENRGERGGLRGKDSG